MKRLHYILLCSVIIASCDNDVIVDNNQDETYLPETEIFVQGQQLFARGQQNAAATTRASYTWPSKQSVDGCEVARFTIRADGKVVDFSNKTTGDYYGRSGNTGNNKGLISSLYPYGHYNDRDLDYTKKDRKTGENIGWFRYVYDPKGLKTQLAIVDAPSVVTILTDVKQDLEADIEAGRNVVTATRKLNQINGWLELGAEYLDSHVAWYVIKEVGMQYGWHVNGVITDTIVQDYAINPDVRIPDNVEIDIHQQEHQDWDEIKTSIHIRTDCGAITLNLPLEYETIVEQDNFSIRAYDYYYKEYVISHEIMHDEDGITIRISDIPASLIEELKERFGDGLTIEIHSFCNVSDYWDRLKQSCVIGTQKPCTVIGQITSAFHDELVPIKNMNNKP